jgi:FkbM family methyltransferase
MILRGYLRTIGYVPEPAWWLVEDLKRRLVPAVSPKTVRIGSSLKLEVDLTSAIGRTVYFHGTSEPALARFIGRALKPGMTFIDAGANLGEFAIRGARRVGPTGRVVALEASPTTAEHLERNVCFNRLGNVQVVRAAVCDHDAPQSFHLGRGRDSGSSSLSTPHDYVGETIVVEGIRLDTLAKMVGLLGVDYIKLDVEGAELTALQGAIGLLSGPNPPTIAFEYNPEVARRAGWELDEIARLLGGMGYTLKHLELWGEGAPVAGPVDRNCNIIAVPPAQQRGAWSRTDRPR